MREASASHEMARVASNRRKLGERHRTVSPSEPLEGAPSANTTISDFGL